MTFMVSITMATDLAQPLLKLNKWYWSKVIRAISRVCYLYFFLNRCCSWVHETLTLNLLKNHSAKGATICATEILTIQPIGVKMAKTYFSFENTQRIKHQGCEEKREWSKVVKGLAKQIFHSSTTGNVWRTVLRICIPG